MLKAFEAFIKEHQLFTYKQSLLVALSGGVDSVVLCHVLRTLGYNFSLAHVNYQLRGAESDADEDFCQKLADEYSVNFYTIKFNTQALLGKTDDSLQMLARKLRYDWFTTIMQKHSHEVLLTAHHANDNAETILQNLARGTGIAGLHGILPKNNHIARPLLFATKLQIEQYAKENLLSWRSDSSNVTDKYKRNFIRHHIIPQFERVNPSFTGTMLTTAQRMQWVENSFLFALNDFVKNNVLQVGDTLKIPYSLCTEPSKGFLAAYLESFGFGFFQIKTIFNHTHASGKKFLSSTHTLFCDRESWLIIPIKSPLDEVFFIDTNPCTLCLPIGILEISEANANDAFEKRPTVAYLNKEKIHFPLKIRRWQPGDVFQPLGMKGKKKVSDFLIDSKVPVPEKQNVWVIETQGEIAWVIGYRISEKFKATTETGNAIKIAFNFTEIITI